MSREPLEGELGRQSRVPIVLLNDFECGTLLTCVSLCLNRTLDQYYCQLEGDGSGHWVC